MGRRDRTAIASALQAFHALPLAAVENLSVWHATRILRTLHGHLELPYDARDVGTAVEQPVTFGELVDDLL